MEPLSASTRWPLAALSLSMLLASLATSIANVALPTLAEAFSASFQAVQWVVLAYLLAITTLIVSVGRLGDLVGRRRLLLAGLVVFTAASAFCGVASSLGFLVAARAVQGLGAAVMMALTVAFVGETVPKARTGSAMGLLGTMSAVGTALGPSLGGVLIAVSGWRAVFFVVVPLGLAGSLLVYRFLPADRAAATAGRTGFDYAGTLVLASTLAAYALAMTLGRGSFGWLNGGLLVAAAMGVGLFVRVETAAASPLLRLAMFRDRVLSAGLAASALVSTVVMATLVVGPFYLSRELGLDAVAVGLIVSVGPVVVALTGVPAGRLADLFGASRLASLGLAAIAAGSFLLAMTPVAWGIPGYVAPMVIITAGYALFQTANNTLVMAEVPADRRGVVSGMLNLSRNLGLVSGASVMGALYSLGGMPVTFGIAGLMIVGALVMAGASRRGAPYAFRPG